MAAKKSRRFHKTVLSPGRYHSPDGHVDVTPERLQHWARQHQRLVENGQRVPVSLDHATTVESSLPMSTEQLVGSVDANKGRSVGNTVGFLESIKPLPDGNGAEIVLELKNDRAIELAESNTGFVSPVIFTSWTDGRGNKYDDLITHCDIVNHPVDSYQSEFTALGLRMGLSTDSEGKPLVFRLAADEESGSKDADEESAGEEAIEEVVEEEVDEAVRGEKAAAKSDDGEGDEGGDDEDYGGDEEEDYESDDESDEFDDEYFDEGVVDESPDLDMNIEVVGEEEMTEDAIAGEADDMGELVMDGDLTEEELAYIMERISASNDEEELLDILNELTAQLEMADGLDEQPEPETAGMAPEDRLFDSDDSEGSDLDMDDMSEPVDLDFGGDMGSDSGDDMGGEYLPEPEGESVSDYKMSLTPDLELY